MRILTWVTVLMMGSAVYAETPATMTVSGAAQVQVVPDMATVTLGTTARDSDAVTAMNTTSEALDAIIARLAAHEIAARDIQTSSLSLREDRRWDNQRNAEISEGFVASNQLRVRVRDLDKLDEVLAASLADGANTLSGLQFGLSDPGPAQDEARQQAVRNAIAKAKLYADAAGVELGPVVSISDVASAQGGFAADMPVMLEAARSVPVAAGEIEAGASVTVIFAIN
jgi:uncharacterized protein YggE